MNNSTISQIAFWFFNTDTITVISLSLEKRIIMNEWELLRTIIIYQYWVTYDTKSACVSMCQHVSAISVSVSGQVQCQGGTRVDWVHQFNSPELQSAGHLVPGAILAGRPELHWVTPSFSWLQEPSIKMNYEPWIPTVMSSQPGHWAMQDI